jgi:hypothetical protein
MNAELRWKWEGKRENLAGFKVYMKDTKSPYLERVYFAGPTESFLLKNVSIDDWTFGVSAIGTNGLESLVSIYRMPPRRRAEYTFEEIK